MRKILKKLYLMCLSNSSVNICTVSHILLLRWRHLLVPWAIRTRPWWSLAWARVTACSGSPCLGWLPHLASSPQEESDVFLSFLACLPPSFLPLLLPSSFLFFFKFKKQLWLPAMSQAGHTDESKVNKALPLGDWQSSGGDGQVNRCEQSSTDTPHPGDRRI